MNFALLYSFTISMVFGMPLNNDASARIDLNVNTLNKDVLIHNFEKQLSDSQKAKVSYFLPLV